MVIKLLVQNPFQADLVSCQMKNKTMISIYGGPPSVGVLNYVWIGSPKRGLVILKMGAGSMNLVVSTQLGKL